MATSRTRRTRRALAVGSGAFVLMTAGSSAWLAHAALTSPDHDLAASAAPAPSIITAPVERRVLQAGLTLRGTGRYSASVPVSLQASSVVPTLVVTQPPTVGRSVADGDVLLTVSGRPVMVVQGAVPEYRDIRPGDQGPDVAQLETTLARLGFDPGPLDGIYDSGAQHAVTALYRSRGFDPVLPSAEQQQAIRSARQGVLTARMAAEDAGATLAALTAPPSPMDSLKLQTDLSQTQRSVVAADENAHKVTVDVQDQQTAAQIQLDAAVRAETTANASLDSARARGDAAAAIEELVTAVGAAHDQVRLAQLAVASQQRDAAAAVAAALDLRAAAHDAAALAGAATTSGHSEDDIRRARSAYLLATATSAAATDDLTQLEDSTGVVVPASDLVYVDSLPRRVESTELHLGSPVTGPVATLSAASTEIASTVSAAERALVPQGSAVQIEGGTITSAISATVTSIADQPGTDGADPQTYRLIISLPPDAASSGGAIVGAAVRIRVVTASSSGPVLVVPEAAVHLDETGGSFIDATGTTGRRRVPVAVGLASAGSVQITPQSGSLDESDAVVVSTGAPS